MKTFEELTEAEKELRTLIYAIEVKDKHNPYHPFPMGDIYLNVKLQEAKQTAIKLGIPLVEITF